MDTPKSGHNGVDHKLHEPTEQDSEKLRQIYRNLPSYYLHWSPQSSRKQIRPPELTGPTCRPRDPSPVHYNKPDADGAPIYRRVNFSPNRRRNPFRSAVSLDSVESCHNIPSTDDKTLRGKLDNDRCRNYSPGRVNIRGCIRNGLAAANNKIQIHKERSYAGQNAKKMSTPKYSSQTDLVLTAEDCISLKSLKADITNNASSPNKQDELSQTAPWRKPTLLRNCENYVNKVLPICSIVKDEKVLEKEVNDSSQMRPKKAHDIPSNPIGTQTNIHQRYEQQANVQQDYCREVPWRSPRPRRRQLPPGTLAQPTVIPTTSNTLPRRNEKVQSNTMVSNNKNITAFTEYPSKKIESEIKPLPSTQLTENRLEASSKSVVNVSTQVLTAESKNLLSETAMPEKTCLPESSHEIKNSARPKVESNIVLNAMKNENNTCFAEKQEHLINEKHPKVFDTKTEPSKTLCNIASAVSLDIVKDEIIKSDVEAPKLIAITSTYKGIETNSNTKESDIVLTNLSPNLPQNTIYSCSSTTNFVQASKEESEIVSKNQNIECNDVTQNVFAEVSNHNIESNINAVTGNIPEAPLPPPTVPGIYSKIKILPSLQDIMVSSVKTENELPNSVKSKNLEDAEKIPFNESTIDEQCCLSDKTDYVQESISNRIQRFEKQASFELEKPKDKSLPIVKPVGPWVKKTSSGVVQQDRWDRYDNGFDVEDQQNDVFTSTYSSPSSVNVNIPNQQRKEQNHEVMAMTLNQPSSIQSNFSHRPASKTTTPPVFSKPNEIIEVNIRSPPALATLPSDMKRSDPLFDPWCDPDNPRVVQFQDISAAAFKIKSGVLNTPCTRSTLSDLVGSEIFFKKEFTQHTGSFKERGARYTLLCLSEEQKRKGVIAASAGNHALALSYHGLKLDIPVTVVMPLVAPIMKVQACRQYGANVIVRGCDIGECKEIAVGISRENDLLYLNGYDHPHILAGQGTMGLEIVEQVRDIDAVVVPVGGGGLIAGVALAVKSLFPHIKVIGVESENCASFSAAMQAGRPVKVKAKSTIADGLAVPCVGVNAFATAAHLIDKIVTVKEEWIAIAILRLVEMEKAVVEGGGATGLAAILAGELPELRGKRIVVPLCGGNIDTTVLGRCLDRGLAADGRLAKFTVTVSDRPGGIAELTKLLANVGASIKDIMHERAWIKNDIFSVEVKVVCETRDYEHFQQLKTELEARYPKIRFPLPNQIAEECNCYD